MQQVNGTVKRTAGGALVAEVAFDPTATWGLKGQLVTVDGTTARVADIGSRFKARGYARVYLYLDEPTATPSGAPIPTPSRPAVRMHAPGDVPHTRVIGPTAEDEDAEDRGERTVRFPLGIEAG